MGIGVGVTAVRALEVYALDGVVILEDSTVRLGQDLGGDQELPVRAPVVSPPVNVLYMKTDLF